VEAMVNGESLKEFVTSSRVGCKVYITQRYSNSHGWYLALAKYGGGGGGQRGFIVIPKGREGRGWSSCVVKLRKVVAFLESYFDDGSRALNT
jgi:hypothetical protein